VKRYNAGPKERIQGGIGGTGSGRAISKWTDVVNTIRKKDRSRDSEEKENYSLGGGGGGAPPPFRD